MATISAASIILYKDSLPDTNISTKDFLLHVKNFIKDNKSKINKSTRPPSPYNIFMKNTIKFLKDNENPDFVNTKLDNTNRFKKAATMWKTHPSNKNRLISDKVASDDDKVASDDDKVASDDDKVASDDDKVASDDDDDIKVASDDDKTPSDDIKVASDDDVVVNTKKIKKKKK